MSFSSDLIAGLEHVFALQDSLPIAAVNISLGAGQFTDQDSCDTANAATKAAIDNLRSVGIATVISSGNGGSINSLSAPACISTAVSVGSTTKTDGISSFSNSAAFLSLLAPGESITSSIPSGGFEVKSGTSTAAPHVAGAWAILKQQSPQATVSEVLSALQTTGLPMTDPRNGVTTSRIRIFHALGGQPRVMEFPFAPNGFGLTFSLIVTNRVAQPQPVTIITVPSGQSAIQLSLTLGPAQIMSLDPGALKCASGLVCRLGLTFGGGAIPAFDAVLAILSTTGVPVNFLTPTLASQ